jgi:hypothetical protein
MTRAVPTLSRVCAAATAVAALALPLAPAAAQSTSVAGTGATAATVPPTLAATSPATATAPSATATERISQFAGARLAADLAALEQFRPGYAFWQHVFAVPDGAIAYGSGVDGRLLAVFPAAGDWTSAGRWHDPALATLLHGRSLPPRLDARRDEVAQLLEAAVGPVLHNPTRGRFVLRNVPAFGAFVGEWGAIYERFGVPADIGLAQAIVESGLSGTIRSEARAIGFCQWLEGNWNKLKRLAPHVIEAQNQTTQAPYCAAYLTILATKYGSFLPALSEHHAGGTNVGRVVYKGVRLGGEDVRSQYFLGSQFALTLRQLSPERYSELYRTYGPRSFRYTELVFGNTATAARLREETPQTRIFAMRAPRAIPLADVVRRSGLTADQVRRYNPALVRQVPAGANLYLPSYIAAFGPNVSFWHRPAPASFAEVLADFLALSATPEEWDSPAFERVLRDFQRRFQRSGTEEGTVMSVVLAYVADEARTSRRGAILAEYRTSPRTVRLLDEALLETGANVPVVAR